MLPMGFQAGMFGASEGWHEEGEAADFRISRQQSFCDCALGAVGGGRHLAGVATNRGVPVDERGGHALPLGPAAGQSAFVVTEFQDAEDFVADCCSRYWLTLEDCQRRRLRSDHLRLLQRLSCHASEAPEHQRDPAALAITDLEAEAWRAAAANQMDEAGISAGLPESQEPAARRPRGAKRKRCDSGT